MIELVLSLSWSIFAS